MDIKQNKNKRTWYQRLTDKQANVWLTSGTVVVAFVLVFGVFLIAKYGNREVGTSSSAAFFRTKGAPGAVTQPVKAQVWNPGLTEDIKWAANRLPGETRVIVALHPVSGSCPVGDTACKTAAKNPYLITQDPIPNNGSLSWVVPFSLPDGFHGQNMQITVAAPGATSGIDSEAFTINAPDAAANLTITTSDSLKGDVGDPFSATFIASGGTEPYSFNISGGALPPGMEIQSDTIRDCASGSDCLPADDVIISGTPTKDGSYSFTLETTDSTGQSGNRDFVIVIGGESSAINESQSTGGGVSDVVGKVVTVPMRGSVTFGDYTITYVQNLCLGSKTCTLSSGLLRVFGHNRTDEATMHNGDTHVFLTAGTGGVTITAQSFLATKAVLNIQ